MQGLIILIQLKKNIPIILTMLKFGIFTLWN